MVPVPPGVVIEISPVDPVPTVAVILVGELTVNDVDSVPPKLTAVAPVKFVPVIVTIVPVAADAGVKDVIAGPGINMNPPIVAVPPGVVILRFPDAPDPTTAVIAVDEFTVNELAAIPPKLTAEAPVKLAPVMVTVSPEAADAGENDVMVGCWESISVLCTFVFTGKLKSK